MALLFGIGVCVMGGQLNFPAMAADLFPPHVRGAGIGWTVGVGREPDIDADRDNRGQSEPKRDIDELERP